MKTFADFHAAGNIPEAVINAAFDISVTERPLTGTIAHIGAKSSLQDWIDHVLRPPNTDNKIIDGADAQADDTSEGVRYVQPMQLQEAGIRLGDQAQESDSFANLAKFETQLGYRVSELYRDTEARALANKASVLPVTNTVAGECAGFFAQVKTNVSLPGDGVVGGWNPGTGVFVAATQGTTRPLSEDDFLTVCESMSKQGSDADQTHMIPEMKRKFSSYLMSSSSRIGVLVTQAPGGQGGATAVASVQVIETDFFVLQVINNRIMQEESANITNIAIVQSNMAECADQWTPRAKRLGPGGAGERWQVTNASGLLLLNERAHGAVFTVDQTAAMIP